MELPIQIFDLMFTLPLHSNTQKLDEGPTSHNFVDGIRAAWFRKNFLPYLHSRRIAEALLVASFLGELWYQSSLLRASSLATEPFLSFLSRTLLGESDAEERSFMALAYEWMTTTTSIDRQFHKTAVTEMASVTSKVDGGHPGSGVDSGEIQSNFQVVLHPEDSTWPQLRCCGLLEDRYAYLRAFDSTKPTFFFALNLSEARQSSNDS